MALLKIFLVYSCFLTIVKTETDNKSSGGNSKKVVCYYTNWSQYRQNIGKFYPEDVDPFLCTHIIFAFGWMKKNQLSAHDASDESKDGKKGLYERVTELKKKNSDLKILLAVGGWSFGTKRFKDMASNSYNRKLFIFSAVEFLRQRNFDGLDLDWEFPRGTSDKTNFVELVKEIRETFEAEAKENRLPRLLLTAAVSAGAENVKGGYDVPAVAAYVDFLNVMSYDFHGKWERQTGHNSPLYAPKDETNWRKQLCIDYGVKLWEKLGAPKDKLVIGMATYGRSFTLADPRKNSVNVPTTGGGKAGEYTKEAGFLAYYEVCEMLKKGATYVWDDDMKVPYAYLGDQWVGFDDERSIRIKMKWIKEHDYAGAMVWTVDMDDFKGSCTERTYPLIGVMAEELLGRPSKGSTYSLESIIKTAPKPTLPPANSVDIIRPETLQKPEDIETVAVKIPESNARIVCYFTNWSFKRKGLGTFEPEHIDPELCTHIVFAFAGIKDFKISPTEDVDETHGNEKGLYDRILALKRKNPILKVLLGVGGWMIGSGPFRELTKNTYRKSQFIFNAIEFLRQQGFDGMEINWEFPRGVEDKTRFSELVKDLKEAFDGETIISKKPKLILSAAVPSNFEAVLAGYDVEEVSKYLDIMNVMTYDFHGDWEKQVGHNSPLFPLESASRYQSKLTVDYSAAEWVKRGAPKEKLCIGIPTYGRSFTLSNTSLTDIGAPAVGGGQPGNYTGESGFLSFFEICDFLKSGAVLVWDNEQMVPYAYKDDQWVGFDDLRSVKLKAQWLMQAGYGGVMIWSLDMDDFMGSCMGFSYPLIRTLKEELKDYKVANLEALSSNIHNSLGQLIDPEEVVCEEPDGIISYHRDVKECSKYFLCQGKIRYHMPCPDQLVFNANENVCDWPENVEGCMKT
ncbi:putative chitinase 10 [Tachypleus tridentatus]|uniref:putative chitinase 10 n=1 Tax=Tachypleus tridentatus TaxID=6853 RepID=UPI003FD50ABE